MINDKWGQRGSFGKSRSRKELRPQHPKVGEAGPKAVAWDEGSRGPLEKAGIFFSKGLSKTTENVTISIMSMPKPFYGLQCGDEV